jgi:hypothetical protein
MPKLLLFAPCEKAIIDQNNVISLITVLQEITVDIPEMPDTGGKMPVVPLKWDVVSLWMKTDEDAPDTVYQTRLALIDPTGKPAGLEGSSEFSFADNKSRFQSVTTILGFPIRHEGRYVVRVWLQKKDEDEGEPVTEFPILLIRKRPKE